MTTDLLPLLDAALRTELAALRAHRDQLTDDLGSLEDRMEIERRESAALRARVAKQAALLADLRDAIDTRTHDQQARHEGLLRDLPRCAEGVRVV